MKRKNDNKTVVFVIFVIILTIIALIATSGTYAKYTSEFTTKNSTATVAKWSVKLDTLDQGGTASGNPIDMAKASSSTDFDFNIFKYITDTDPNEDEENVAAGKIAPGTSGAFSFQIENASEVDIKYYVEFSDESVNLPDGTNIPILFALNEDTNYQSMSEFNNSIKNNAILIDMNESSIVTIKWKWAYEVDADGNSNDLALGTADTLPVYNVHAKITATQVD